MVSERLSARTSRKPRQTWRTKRLCASERAAVESRHSKCCRSLRRRQSKCVFKGKQQARSARLWSANPGAGSVLKAYNNLIIFHSTHIRYEQPFVTGRSASVCQQASDQHFCNTAAHNCHMDSVWSQTRACWADSPDSSMNILSHFHLICSKSLYRTFLINL